MNPKVTVGTIANTIPMSNMAIFGAFLNMDFVPGTFKFAPIKMFKFAQSKFNLFKICPLNFDLLEDLRAISLKSLVFSNGYSLNYRLVFNPGQGIPFFKVVVPLLLAAGRREETIWKWK